jgi:hypothetical protein
MLATAGAIAAAALLAHAPALRGGFVFDDRPLLLDRDAPVQRPLSEVWLGADAPDWLPVTWTVLWIEYRLWGDDPRGYHAVNLALHVAAAVLLWRALRALGVPGAALAGVLFAIHPVTVESVAWISEHKNTVSALPFLGAALAWIRYDSGGRRRDAVAAAALLALAVLAKASTVMLPIALLAVPLLRRGRIERSDLVRLAPLLAIALAGGLVAVWFQRTHAMAGMALPSRDVAERIGGAGWALLTYPVDAFLPLRLAFLRPEWPVGPESPLFWAPLAALTMAAAAIWRFRTGWARPVLPALGWHTALVLPVLGLLDMAWLAFAPVSDHLQYLALAGPVALVAAGFDRLRRAWPRAAVAAAVALTAGAAGLSAHRATAFESDATLWRAAVRDAPESAMAHYQLGLQLLREGRGADAVREFQAMEARERDPALRHRARALAALFSGRAGETVLEATRAGALRPDPDFDRQVARQLFGLGAPRAAAAVLEAAARASPGHAGVRHDLAALLGLDRDERPDGHPAPGVPPAN